MTDLFLLQLDNQADVCGGPANGTEYSLDDACPRCGTGAIQTGPLILPSFKVPKHEIFMTLDDEVLVSARVADLLRAAGVRAVRNALGAASRDPLPISQLVAEATLPRFLPESSGTARERPCTACDRDGYFGIPHVPLRLKYPILGPMAGDVFATYERFGNSRLRDPFKDSVLAAPRYLASARLTELLRAQNLKGLLFEPVEGG